MTPRNRIDSDLDNYLYI
jgi:hypothetical protein